MKKFVAISVIFSLIVSLAAPSGAAFASEGVENDGAMLVAKQTVPGDADVGKSNATEANELEDSVDTLDAKSTGTSPEVVPSQTESLVNKKAIGDLQAESLIEKEVDEAQGLTTVASTVVITELQTRGSAGASSELVELFNASDQDIDITGWCVQYASASGASYSNKLCIEPSLNESGLRVVLPSQSYTVFATEGFVTANEGFVPDGKLTSGMADTGGSVRVVDQSNQVVDLLGWGGSVEFESSAAPQVPTSLPVRSLQRLMMADQYQDTGSNFDDFGILPAKTSYQTGALYEVIDLCSNLPGLQQELDPSMWRSSNGQCFDKSSINLCEGLIINEVAANTSKQYIELVNVGKVKISLSGCAMATNQSKQARFVLPDASLEPDDYIVVYIDETDLKLTKSTLGTVYLIASDVETEVDSAYYKDLSVDTSWSRFPDGWRQTYSMTPGQQNKYMQYASCQEGYWRNEETGRCNKLDDIGKGGGDLKPCAEDQFRHPETNRCRKISSIDEVADCGEGRERNAETNRCRNTSTDSQLTPCREGQYRSEETNRCRSIASAASALKPCADDQFRNLETNRCKKIASVDELSDCGEGRERNPETNRCRNVLAAATLGEVPFAPEQVTQTAEGMASWWAIGGLSLLAVAYAGWQWRFEVSRLTRRVVQLFVSGKS